MPALLADRFALQAAARPQERAIVAPDDTVTYGELRQQVEAVAQALSGRRRIAILPRAEVGSLAVVLGAMSAGTSVVLLDRHLTAAQAERVLAVAAPELVVASGRHPRAVLDRVEPGDVRSPQALVRDGAGRAGRPRRAQPGDELLVGLTSGTSGEPKLFARDQASWATTLDRSDRVFDVRPGDVVSTPGPLDHGHFFYGALHALTRGATVDLRPLAAAFAAGSSVTHAYLVPTLAVDLVELLAQTPCESVREVVSSAAPWPGSARERLRGLLPGATVTHFYGASELSFVSLDSSRVAGPDGTAGLLFEGVEVEIRGPGGRRVADGEQGEVHVRSDMLFRGYLSPDGYRGGPGADGWFTVGDLGTMRDGWLSIAGRGSETIISGGFNVEPAQVERSLAELGGVADAACVGLPDARWGALPAAVLVLDGSRSLTRAQVRAHARSTLPPPSRPRRVFVVEELPRSPRGKLLRARLLTQVVEQRARELA